MSFYNSNASRFILSFHEQGNHSGYIHLFNKDVILVLNTSSGMKLDSFKLNLKYVVGF